ncbi:hypothetical protein U1Q18_007313 [Sarracenia purpurea var. burkii]
MAKSEHIEASLGVAFSPKISPARTEKSGQSEVIVSPGKSPTKLSEVFVEALDRQGMQEDFEDSEDHTVSGRDQRNDGDILDDDSEAEDIDMLTLQRNVLVRDKSLAEHEIQIIDEVQRARVNKGKGIANLEPGEHVFGQPDKAQVSQQFFPRGLQVRGGGRLGPGGRGGPKSPIKNLQEVGLCGDRNRFASLLEDPVINEKINVEIPAAPISASQSDAVQSEIVATSTSTGTLDHPTNALVPNQIVIAGHMDDIPASEHIEISVEKGEEEDPGPPQNAPVQPMLLPSNKKLGRSKKNKQSFVSVLLGEAKLLTFAAQWPAELVLSTWAGSLAMAL